MNHDLLLRAILRCHEIAAEPNVPAVVKVVHDDLLKAPADEYQAANAALVKAESAWGKEGAEATQALQKIDGPFRIARSVMAAYVPTTVIPDTLKAARTDTDKLGGIEGLFDLAEEHKDEPWGKTVLDGEFGKMAPVVIKEVNEAIAANKELSAARDARAKAYGLAYEKYLAFKRVVREAYGSTSKQYHRIHFRARDNETPQPPVVPNPGAPVAPVAPTPNR